MAWTAPRTYIAGELFTAAIGNTDIRDNFLATAPAKATAAGDIFYATGANAIARLAKGTDGQVLTLASGLPSWVTAAASFIQSLQSLSGTFSSGSTTLDLTCTGVTTALALLIPQLAIRDGSTDFNKPAETFARYDFTTTTNVRGTRGYGTTYAGLANPTHRVWILEFKVGILNSDIQRGTLTQNSSAVTATISTVTTARAFVTWLGSSTTAATAEIASCLVPTLQFNSSTQIQSNIASSGSANATIGYQVAEFASTVF